MTTPIYLVLDPLEESLEVVVAGHPPALVIRPSGAAAYLRAAGRAPARGHARRPPIRPRRSPCPTGATLLLYTDGLVERRGESIDLGLERLRALGEGVRATSRRCARRSSTAGRRGAGRRRRVRRRARPPLTDHLDALAGDAGEPGRHPLPAAPLAGRPRRGRGGDLRDRRRLPGGVRERHRARLRPRCRRVRARSRPSRRPDHPDHLRSRPLAAVARREPRPRPPHDAGAHGHGRRPPDDDGTDVVLTKRLGTADA